MKVDAMTVGAVGFAAFAAWYALKRKPVGALNDGQQAFAAATQTRRDVGANTYQNTDWILTGMTPDGFTPNINGVPRTGAYVPWEG